MSLDLLSPPSSAQYLRWLLAAKDPTQALQLAADHVATVLDCPVSWAGLVEGDYLVMGAHHGVASTEMAAAWRLKIGEGIGGRVALERRPQMSRDYRHDSRRVPLLKRLIDNEGIQATLIVPILVADSLLGVLYAAHRHPYPWSDTEVEMLEEIAHDLGVRLHQLDVDGRRGLLAAAAERRAERATREQRACADLANGFATHTDPVGSLDLLARELGGRVELRQGDGTLVRAAGELRPGNPRVVRRTVLADCGGLTVVVIDTRDPDEQRQAFVDLCISLFRLQVLRVGERERTAERLNGELFDALLSGRLGDPEEFRARVSMMGVDLGPGAQVLVAGGRDGEPVGRAELDSLLRPVFPGVVTLERAGRAVAVLPPTGRPPARVRAQLTDALTRSRRGWTVGLGRSCAELLDFATSYDEARAACELAVRGAAVGTAVGSGVGSVVTAHELGILGMASLPAAHLETTVRDVLGPLLDLDQRRGTDFVPTLRTYLAHDRHLPDTAASLHVHYNTVRNRVARIEEVLGVDMRDVDHRFRLETALRMHALSTALAGA
ncbi:helix-turn-helix domain-containing protein [Nocardioides sp. BYT-33-1]|uniref:helix-turn-helix domain-containing protein n=1 Tax=Nocardioides sp. BYT-33-1 TaxID=3416952 RepID=UPI003F5392C5